MHLLKSWLTPPVLQDEQKTHQAYLLHFILLALISIPLPFVIYLIIQAPAEANRALVIITVAEIINIALFIMLRRGYASLASIIHIFALWLIFLNASVASSSIYGVAYMLGNALVITIAGLLLGSRGSLAITLLSIIAGGVMVYAEIHGWTPPDILDDPISTWVVIIVLFAVGASLQNIAARETNAALNRALASEERYRLISQVSSDYTFSTELDSAGNMRLNWVAGALEKITGYRFDDYVTHGGWLAHLHPDDREKDAQALERLKTNQEVIHDVRTYKKDGELLWVRVYAHPVVNDKNILVRIIGAVQNINEQKLIEEREQQRRDLLEKIIKLGQYVTEERDVRATLQRIWHSVHDDMDFDRLGIYLYDPQRNAMNGTYGTNNQGEMVEEWHAHISLDKETIETISFTKSMQEANGLYFTQNYEVEHAIQNGNIMYGVKDYAAVAAWAGDKPVAVLCVDNLITQRLITHEKLEALRLFAGYAGLAIENARLNDALQNELAQQKQAEEREAQRRTILEKVIVLGQHVTEVSDLRTTLIKIWHGIHDTLEFDRLGIFLYNPERDSMDGTLGTNNEGQIVEEWDQWFPLSEVALFQRAIEKSDSIYFTHNYDVENQFDEGHEMYGVKDFAAVAAWAGGKPVAVICVDRVITQKSITEAQLEALRLFSGYAGLAIQNARLNDALENELNEQKQAEELEARRRRTREKVLALGKSVTEVSDLRTTVHRIWDGIHDDLGFDRLAIFLYNLEDNSMEDTFGTDRQGQMADYWGTSFPLTGDITDTATFQRVLEKPDGYYYTQNYDVAHNIPAEHNMYGVKEFAAVAAWAGDRPIAVICVDNLITSRSITEDQLEALRLFAGYAGLAISNARLKDALQNELIQQKQAEELEIRRREILEKVILLSKQVTEVSDLQTTLERIWHGIHDELGFDRLAIFLYDQASHSVRGTLGTSNQGEIVEEWDYARSLKQDKPTSFTRALEQTDGVFFTNNFSVEFNIPEDHEMYEVRDFAAVTAWGGERPVAIITVDNFPSRRPIDKQQLEALRLFSGYAGLAIENARLNTALERDLSQRKTLIEELETKNVELERFTYTVSHDLKSPLVTITGFLGFLERDATTGSMEKVRSTIDRINNAAHKMQALLNDLLELSRIGRLMNLPENIPFSEIVNEATDRVRGRLDEANAIIEIQSELPMVYGDRVRLIEVVQNLMENAAKYSSSKAHPRIEIGTQPKVDGHTIFFVRDNGIGIAPEYHDKIFGLFNKLDPTAEGTGIGLTLVKRIIEVHGGRIWVESAAGKGATFYFTLPDKQNKE